MGQAYGWAPAGRPGCPPSYGVGQPRPNAAAAGAGYCSGPVHGVYMVPPGQCRPDDGYQFVAAGPGFPVSPLRSAHVFC